MSNTNISRCRNSGSCGWWSNPQRGASTNTYLIALAVVAVIVVVLVLADRTDGPEDREGEGVAAVETVELAPEQRLNPALFRGQIRALEMALYPSEGANAPSSGGIAAAARRLAEAVRSEGGPSARQAADALSGYAAEVSGTNDVGFTSLDLPAVRASWQELRSVLFQPADWFAGADATAAEVVEQPATDSQESYINDLRRIAFNVTGLVYSGKDEAGYFGEIGVDVAAGSDQAAALREDWLEWAKGWNRRVEIMAATIPPAPDSGAPEDLMQAHRALATAVYQLRLVAMSDDPTGVPSRAERNRLFDSAEEAVTAARTYLTNL